MGEVYGFERTSRGTTRPSPIFLAIVAIFAACGWILWQDGRQAGEAVLFGNASFGIRMATFGFVLAGWIVSLCLHEFSHAFFAYRAGDRSIPAKGYLTLNPLKYSDIGLSFVLPVLFVLFGGIGLPGGAVYIDRGAIHGRVKHSLISAAGPLANVVFAVGLAFAITSLGDDLNVTFWAAVAFLAFLQVTAAVLNLLPVPGLDGFGILEPYLPAHIRANAAKLGGWVFLGIILLLWIPPINAAFFDVVLYLTDTLGIGRGLIGRGDLLFSILQLRPPA